jgi:hypothetical protein
MIYHCSHQYTRYNNLTDDELFAICDDHYANDLIVELRQRLEEASGEARKIEELLHTDCPKCGADLSDIY